MLMQLQISILHYHKKTIICHSHTKRIWKAVLAVFFLNKLLVSLKYALYFPYLPKCFEVLFLALFLTFFFFKITSYIQVRWEYTGRKQKKTLFFLKQNASFRLVGGRIKATLQIWLSIEMKVLKMQVKMC